MAAALLSKSFEELTHPRRRQDNKSLMYNEENRLKTYKNWTNNLVNPKDLAKEGFYYTEKDDNVKCAFCGLGIGGFEKNDKIVDIHLLLSKNCSFIKNKNRCGDIPLDGEDTCGFKTISINKIEPNITKGYAYTAYNNLEKRFKSFKDWPLSMPQRPESLSAAGFFYAGSGDKCICFFCGLGLKDWEKNDDPYEEHAKWSPNCEYLIAKKGKKFIENFRGDKNKNNEGVPVSTNEEPKLKETENNNNIADAKLCQICYSEERQIAFIPCGHILSCIDCAVQTKNCPSCRHPIESTQRIYL